MRGLARGHVPGDGGLGSQAREPLQILELDAGCTCLGDQLGHLCTWDTEFDAHTADGLAQLRHRLRRRGIVDLLLNLGPGLLVIDSGADGVLRSDPRALVAEIGIHWPLAEHNCAAARSLGCAGAASRVPGLRARGRSCPSRRDDRSASARCSAGCSPSRLPGRAGRPPCGGGRTVEIGGEGLCGHASALDRTPCPGHVGRDAATRCGRAIELLTEGRRCGAGNADLTGGLAPGGGRAGEVGREGLGGRIGALDGALRTRNPRGDPPARRGGAIELLAEGRRRGAGETHLRRHLGAGGTGTGQVGAESATPGALQTLRGGLDPPQFGGRGTRARELIDQPKRDGDVEIGHSGLHSRQSSNDPGEKGIGGADAAVRLQRLGLTGRRHHLAPGQREDASPGLVQGAAGEEAEASPSAEVGKKRPLASPGKKGSAASVTATLSSSIMPRSTSAGRPVIAA